VDADEEESDSGEGIGDGAQWTVFFGAGVAAMRKQAGRRSTVNRARHSNTQSRGRVKSLYSYYSIN
jgi:hypothetical protein